MYWAKKILEWTSSPEEALAIALYLNDRYALDGRNPNGFVGCMWSIGGIHDQGWKEREGKTDVLCCHTFRTTGNHVVFWSYAVLYEPLIFPSSYFIDQIMMPHGTVFGKIRYMNYAGCKRKFDVPRFVGTWRNRLLAAKKEAKVKQEVEVKAEK